MSTRIDMKQMLHIRTIYEDFRPAPTHDGQVMTCDGQFIKRRLNKIIPSKTVSRNQIVTIQDDDHTLVPITIRRINRPTQRAVRNAAVSGRDKINPRPPAPLARQQE